MIIRTRSDISLFFFVLQKIRKDIEFPVELALISKETRSITLFVILTSSIPQSKVREKGFDCDNYSRYFFLLLSARFFICFCRGDVVRRGVTTRR